MLLGYTENIYHVSDVEGREKVFIERTHRRIVCLYAHNCVIGSTCIGVPKENQTWNKLDSSMLKSKNQVTLFVNYSYNSFYDFRFSENTYRKQKVMCQNMGFLILYGGYIWTYL